MSTLHTVNKSPFERSTFMSCLNHVEPGDTVLMIENGVVGARKSGAFASVLAKAMPGCKVAVLGPDLAARGLKESDLIDGVTVVDYGGFVDLAASHDRTHAWL